MPLLHTLKETEKLAAKVAEKIKNGGVIFLYGDLGSGKTTFTKFLAKKLGLNEFSIKSPTYTYMREYSLPERKFFHLDLFRIHDLDLINEEVSELLDNKENIIVIEWAEKLNFKVERERIEITFEYVDPQTRKITI